MSAEAAVQLAGSILAALVRAAPEMLALLTPNERDTIKSLIARGNAHLPAAGAASAEMDRIFGESPPPPPSPFAGEE